MKWFAGTATSIATVDNSDAAGRPQAERHLRRQGIRDPEQQDRADPARRQRRGGLRVRAPRVRALALKKDTQWQQAQREAQLRGKDNPLFTGALGMWDNVILYTSPRVRTADDGVASAPVARNVFFGAQACAKAYAYFPDWTEQEFSYGQEAGVADVHDPRSQAGGVRPERGGDADRQRMTRPSVRCSCTPALRRRRPNETSDPGGFGPRGIRQEEERWRRRSQGSGTFAGSRPTTRKRRGGPSRLASPSPGHLRSTSVAEGKGGGAGPAPLTTKGYGQASRDAQPKNVRKANATLGPRPAKGGGY